MADQPGTSQPVTRTLGLPTRFFRGIGLITLAILVLVVGYLVVTWQLEEPEVDFATRLSHVYQGLRTPSEEAVRLAELEERLTGLEASLEAKSRETASSLALVESGLSQLNERMAFVEDKEAVTLVLEEGDLPLSLFTSLYRAQAVLLKTRLELVDANWGRAGREFDLAIAALEDARLISGDQLGESIEDILGDAYRLKEELARQSIIANDLMDVVWHRLGELLSSLGS